MSNVNQGMIVELKNGKTFFIKYGEKKVQGKISATYISGGENVAYLPGTKVILSQDLLEGAKTVGFID